MCLCGGVYGRVFPAPWSLAGVADVNRDGKTDYLLFNPNTHFSVIWYLLGAPVSAARLGPRSRRDIPCRGDRFQQRARETDYALFNPAATRGTALWYLNNNVRIGSASGPTLPAGWILLLP